LRKIISEQIFIQNMTKKPVD